MTRFVRFFLTSLTLAVILTALPVVAEMSQNHSKGAENNDSGTNTSAVKGEGIIKSINSGKQQVTLSRGPIEALGWPAMTMPFKVTDAKLLEGVSVGDEIHFELGGSDNAITSVDPMG